MSSPGEHHCGAEAVGWLSGWKKELQPPARYKTSGAWPLMSAGVTNAIVCFDSNGKVGGDCEETREIEVVRCSSKPLKLLWKLDYAPCGAVYCISKGKR